MTRIGRAPRLIIATAAANLTLFNGPAFYPKAGLSRFLYASTRQNEKGRTPREARPFSVAKYAGEPKLNPAKN